MPRLVGQRSAMTPVVIVALVILAVLVFELTGMIDLVPTLGAR